MGTPALTLPRGMTGPADRGLLDALSALSAALRETSAPSMIIGGIAVIARGVPRLTVDIDATVWAESVELETLIAGLRARAIEGRIPDALDFARKRQVLLLRHLPSGTPLDVSLAWLPFEKEALARASPVDFGGVVMNVAQPEDLVVYKVVAWRDQDRSDVERLLVRHWKVIDLARVRRLVAEFADVLGAPERIQEFESVLVRARGGDSQ